MDGNAEVLWWGDSPSSIPGVSHTPPLILPCHRFFRSKFLFNKGWGGKLASSIILHYGALLAEMKPTQLCHGQAFTNCGGFLVPRGAYPLQAHTPGGGGWFWVICSHTQIFVRVSRPTPPALGCTQHSPKPRPIPRISDVPPPPAHGTQPFPPPQGRVIFLQKKPGLGTHKTWLKPALPKRMQNRGDCKREISIELEVPKLGIQQSRVYWSSNKCASTKTLSVGCQFCI